MKNTLIFTFLLGLVSSPVLAADPMGDYFSKKEPAVLTSQERSAISNGKKGTGEPPQSGNTPAAPSMRASASLPYISGKQYVIVCAVLQVCDITLQQGEQVNGLNVGDPRFMVEPAITGAGASQTLHLVVKPLESDLDTTLIVTTDRRSYHLRLRSSRTEMMPLVTFTYPEDMMAKWQAINSRDTVERQKNTIPETGEYLGKLSFNYAITGSASWKPLRVYNDGRKTIIEMPDTMPQNEAPALLVVRKDGGIFKDADMQMVNYRVQNNRYIVDSVFDKAILVAGVGSSQDRITIVRGN